MALSSMAARAALAGRRAAARGARGRARLSTQPPGAAKVSPRPAPPTTPPPPEGSGNGSNVVPLLLVAALGGAAYMYQDQIMGMVNGGGAGGATVEDTGLPIQKLKSEVEALGAKIEAEVVREQANQATKQRLEEEAAAAAKAAAAAAAAAAKPATDTVSQSSSSSKDAVIQKPGKVDYAKVREAIVDILDEPGYDDGSIGPLLVRLAWHSAGTYDKNTGRGGSEGACMRYENHPEAGWGANAGLNLARARLEKIKEQFPEITYSDLWSFAGTVALEEMGGPEFKWRPGRRDLDVSCNSLPDGLLPDADGRGKNPADHLRDIFYRMGFNDQEIVALSGAHALGRCHTDRSGFWGPWTRAPTTFSNEYFRLLLEETWSKKTTHEGKEWRGPLQYENSETGSDLMMLETDMALVQDAQMKPYVELYAKDEARFMKDFAAAWIKLQELGVRRFHGRRRYFFFGPRE